MCYSTEASLIAWTVSIIIAGYLWFRNKNYDRWNALFIMSFSAVQLFEAGIWSSNSPEIYVKLILLSLAIQPFVQTFGALKYVDNNSRFLQGLLIIYAIIIIYSLYRIFTQKFSVDQGPNGHLIWKASDGALLQGLVGYLYLFGLLAGLLYGLPKMFPLILIGFVTLIWSIKRVTTKEIGSYWCYTAVAYSFVSLLI